MQTENSQGLHLILNKMGNQVLFLIQLLYIQSLLSKASNKFKESYYSYERIFQKLQDECKVFKLSYSITKILERGYKFYGFTSHLRSFISGNQKTIKRTRKFC